MPGPSFGAGMNAHHSTGAALNPHRPATQSLYRHPTGNPVFNAGASLVEHLQRGVRAPYRGLHPATIAGLRHDVGFDLDA